MEGKNPLTSKSRERLIVFTRYPEPGKTKTRLIPLLGEKGAAELQRQMTEHVLSRVRPVMASRGAAIEVRYAGECESAMRRWLGPDLIYHPQDKDADLGQRMGGAFGEAFGSGDEAAVIIGTDIPGITRTIIENAFDSLGENPLVFGPAKDGGYYLAGMGKTAFEIAVPPLFTGLKWGTPGVFAKTSEIARRLELRYALVDVLEDVDVPEDMPVWEKTRDP